MGCCASQIPKDAKGESASVVQVNPAFYAARNHKKIDENTALSVYHLCTVLRPQCLQVMETWLAASAPLEASAASCTIAHMVSGYIKPLTTAKRTSYLKHVVANFKKVAGDTEGKLGASHPEWVLLNRMVTIHVTHVGNRFCQK